jgi:NitT/TauT family transport system substrate-binding protein
MEVWRGKMIFKNKVFIFFLTALALLAFFQACHKKEASLINVNVGYVPIVGDLPIFVAMEKGFFLQEGLAVNLVEFASGNAAMDALLTNRTVMQATIGSSTLFSIEEKSPNRFKVILSSDETEEDYGAYILVRSDLKINSLAELKGKKIGTYTGLTHLLNLKMILRNGLDPEKDVEIVQI